LPLLPKTTELYVPRRQEIEKNQETSADYHSSTYLVSGVRFKDRIMDGKSSTINSDGSSVLIKDLHAPPAKNWSKEISGRF
jgi:hypothetical protein